MSVEIRPQGLIGREELEMLSTAVLFGLASTN
jgi:hypothetical protein